jgi:hypothetical protein
MINNSTCMLIQNENKIYSAVSPLVKCDIGLCEKCSKTGQCLKCKPNAFYDRIKGECVCRENYISKDNSCHITEKCNKNVVLCDRCFDERCVKCNLNAVHDESGVSCSCRKGFQFNSDKNSCEKIDLCMNSTSCENCVNSECKKCRENSFLNGTTHCTCEKGFIYDETKDRCKKKKAENKKCNENRLCNECTKRLVEKCEKCKKKAHLENSRCVCNKGFIHFSQENKCIEIQEICQNSANNSLCLKCDGKTCIQCKKHAKLSRGKCECIEGFEYIFSKDQCRPKKEKRRYCKKFNQLCKECDENEKCMKCFRNSVLNITENKCYCKENFTYNFFEDKCEHSIQNNNVCEESVDKLCTKCYLGKKCVECGPSSYLNPLSNSCTCFPGFQFSFNKNKCVRQQILEKPCINRNDSCLLCDGDKCKECKEIDILTENNQCECRT